ncbi:MAG: DUF2799 domain-containing protein [Nitrospinaceae bacterium]|jgi:hypothetical protein
MNIIRPALCILILLGVSSCATMNKSECQKADWQVIGLEDGAKGRPVSYIGNHREACAEHGVKPDLAQYNIGRETGLKQYCTYRKGFSRGRSGYSYNDVCQAELQGIFLAGYNRGRELYGLDAEIHHLVSDIKSKKIHLAEVDKEIQWVESKLISKKGSRIKRANLLDRFKQLQTEQAILENDIQDLELEAARKQDAYDALISKQSY